MTSNISKSRFSLVLWASYVLTMLASIGHLAWTFGTLEPAGFAWVGWLPAVSIDAGLAALAYAIQQRKRAGRRAWSLWGGVAVFAGISAYANTLHALSVAPAELGKALVLSAVLPLLVVYLGEIISADDAAAAQAAERQRAREERQLAKADTVTAPAVTPVTPPRAIAAPVSPVAQYAADNGVSLRTAYRHLAKAGTPAASPSNGVAHD